MIQIDLKNQEDTRRLGELIAKFLKGYDIVALDGELGAGKTTLAQSLIRTLGVLNEVTSPTFTLIESYQGEKYPIYHADVYRLKEEPNEIFELGLEEYLTENAIVLIEWANLIEKSLPKNKISVQLFYTKENTRLCQLSAEFEQELLKVWNNEYIGS